MVFITLARISLFPHLRIAVLSLRTFYPIIRRDPPALTHLPSPIFPSPSPHEQYSGLSFLTALTMKLRIVFSKFQTNLPTDPSHLPKYIELTEDDQLIVTRSLDDCSSLFLLPLFLLRASPPIEFDSEIVRELILFVKDALTTILTNMSDIDTLIASLPSGSSPTTPSVSADDTPMTFSLNRLRSAYATFVGKGWLFFVRMTFRIAEPRKSSFHTIILDDPSFPDLIFNSLNLNHKEIRLNIFIAITNIVVHNPRMKDQFMKANVVGRMFETVDLASLPLSESNTHILITRFIYLMFEPIGENEKAQLEHYPHIRASVFEPAKQFIIFIFHNSDRLLLNEKDKTELVYYLWYIHNHIKNMELRSDEHDADFVSELVKWEVRTMVEMENEEPFQKVFRSMLNRTQEWNRDKRERQKRREVLLREEGWDDAFELRVVGIEADTDQNIQNDAKNFRIEQTYNADRR
ncbi:hypothetical protein BLNAU_11445 [Blattamonas nauphoetae]|uniref:Uncharacterized protein n=1 Tax=Blattamonas nauphoetae TaxID=2049346 RepID=A0ABQ9XNG3_9EUKA|nr:hypothetical protein BLNAU_11445 [Blattamonas nauphoetae]